MIFANNRRQLINKNMIPNVSYPVAYLGFHFRGGGGVKNIFGKVGVFARRMLGGFGGMLPQKYFRNCAIWCVLENILLKFCKKIIDNYYCAHYI